MTTEYSDNDIDLVIEKVRNALAALTGEPWQLTDSEHCRPRTLKPSADSTARLYFRNGYGAKSSRLEVSGSAKVCLPRGGYLYGQKHPSATFSAKRDPKAIAKDICRRILPDLRALVIAYEKAAADQKADDENVASYVERLVAAGPSILRRPTDKSHSSSSATLYTYDAGTYGRFEVHASGDCKVELSNLPLGLAVWIAELLEAEAAKNREALASAKESAA